MTIYLHVAPLPFSERWVESFDYIVRSLSAIWRKIQNFTWEPNLNTLLHRLPVTQWRTLFQRVWPSQKYNFRSCHLKYTGRPLKQIWASTFLVIVVLLLDSSQLDKPAEDKPNNWAKLNWQPVIVDLTSMALMLMISKSQIEFVGFTWKYYSAACLITFW